MTYRDDIHSGRFRKEDETPVNVADIIDKIYFNAEHQALGIIDLYRKHVIQGNVYRFSDKISALPTGNSSHILINTGSVSVFVVNVRFSPSNGGIDVTLKEEASISGGTSTSIDIFNTNRESTTNPQTTFTSYDNAATVSGGTNIETLFLSGTGPTGGQSFKGKLHWVLKPDTDYVRTITNNSGGDVDIGVNAEFYEFQII